LQLAADVPRTAERSNNAPLTEREKELLERWVRQGAGYGLRRIATTIEPDPQRPGWDLVEMSFSDVGWQGEHLASFGADVVVVEPADLRDAVIGRLKGAMA